MSVTRPPLFDTHCHVDLHPNPAAIVAEAERQRIYTIAVTNTPSVFPHMEAFAKGSKYVRAAVGLHPQLAAQRHRELPQMWEHLHQTRYVGEIGLDYVTKDEENRKKQRQVFDQILAHCADHGDKVLTIHSRRAAKDVISAIGDNFAGRVILHWYSGSLRELERAIERGFYFSINAAMLNSNTGTRIISRIPRDKLLTETDAPFINKQMPPMSQIQTTVQQLSSLWKLSTIDSARLIHQNFREILQSRL